MCIIYLIIFHINHKYNVIVHTFKIIVTCSIVFVCCVCQVRKTLDATMQTLQDMLTVEDFDVSEAFQHSQSTESVKSASSDSYMSKANIAKRRANQQETEGFYFTVSLWRNEGAMAWNTYSTTTNSPIYNLLFVFFPDSCAEIQGVFEWQQSYYQTSGQAWPSEADARRRWDLLKHYYCTSVWWWYYCQWATINVQII